MLSASGCAHTHEAHRGLHHVSQSWLCSPLLQDGDSSLASDEEEGAGLEGFGLEEMDLSQFLQAKLDDVGDDDDDGLSSSEASASDEWDDLRAGRKRGHGTPRASPLGRRPTVRSTPRKSPASSASGGGEGGGAGSGEQSDSSIDDEDGDGIHPNGLRVIHRPVRWQRVLTHACVRACLHPMVAPRLCGSLPLPWFVVLQADDCFSIKLTLVLAKRRDEPPDLPKLNHWQNRRCAWCRRTQTSGYVGRGTWSYYCTYTELMCVAARLDGVVAAGSRAHAHARGCGCGHPRRYCKVCYGSFKQVIPWRVVHKSDTKKYPVRACAVLRRWHPPQPLILCPTMRAARAKQVCKIAYQYLSMVLSAGVIDLLKYNSRHWATDESWQDLVEMRKKLIEAKVPSASAVEACVRGCVLLTLTFRAVCCVTPCQDSAHQTKGLEKLEELLTNRSHFHMNTNMVSTMDVIAVR